MSKERLIFIAFPPDDFSDAQHAAIRERCAGFEVVISGREEDARRELARVEIAAGDFPRGLLFEAPRLAWFQQWSAGADWLLKQPKARGLAVDLGLEYGRYVFASLKIKSVYKGTKYDDTCISEITFE